MSSILVVSLMSISKLVVSGVIILYKYWIITDRKYSSFYSLSINSFELGA